MIFDDCSAGLSASSAPECRNGCPCDRVWMMWVIVDDRLRRGFTAPGAHMGVVAAVLATESPSLE